MSKVPSLKLHPEDLKPYVLWSFLQTTTYKLIAESYALEAQT